MVQETCKKRKNESGNRESLITPDIRASARFSLLYRRQLENERSFDSARTHTRSGESYLDIPRVHLNWRDKATRAVSHGETEKIDSRRGRSGSRNNRQRSGTCAFRDPWSNFRYFLYLSGGAVFSKFIALCFQLHAVYSRYLVHDEAVLLLRELSRSNLSTATIRQLTIRSRIRYGAHEFLDSTDTANSFFFFLFFGNFSPCPLFVSCGKHAIVRD
jgi:hypothetical protein